MLISALGTCQIHNLDRMSITDSSGNEQIVCIRCRAAGEAKTGRTQIVEDPGEDFNGYAGGRAKITILKEGETAAPVATRRPVAASAGLSLEEIVEKAVAELNSLPMPKDIKEFKKVQKVIKTLQSLTENQNG